MSIPLLLLLRSLIFLSFFHFSYSTFCYTDCFSTKGCFFKPYGCTPYINCSYAVSYQSDGEWAYLELLGKGQSERNSYVAAAFSKDQQMGDDSVVECSSFNNGPLLGRASYNQGKTNIRMEINPSTENSFIRTLAVDYFNGMIYCKLARRVQVPIDVNRTQAFQLDDQHHILMSSGPTTADRNGNGLLQVHSLDQTSPDYPYVTVQTITVNQYRIPLGSVIPVNSYQPYGQSSGLLANPSNQQPSIQSTSFTFNNSQIPLVYPGPGGGLPSNPSAQQPIQNFNGPNNVIQGPGYQNNGQGYSQDGFPLQGPGYEQNGATTAPYQQGSSVNPQTQGAFYPPPSQYDQSSGLQSSMAPITQATTALPYTNGYSSTPYSSNSSPNPGFIGGVVPGGNQPQFDPSSQYSQNQQGYQSGSQGPQNTVTGGPNYLPNENVNQQPGNPYFSSTPAPSTTNGYFGPIAAGAVAGASIGAQGSSSQGFAQNPNAGFQQGVTGGPNNQLNQNPNAGGQPSFDPNSQQNQGPNAASQQGFPGAPNSQQNSSPGFSTNVPPFANQQQQNPQSFTQAPQNNLNQPDPSNNQQLTGGQASPGNVPLRDSYSSQGVIPGSDNPIEPALLKAHAILMTLAWMIFISTAVLFARFYRGFWPNTTVCGLFLWFHFHRTLNILGIACTIAGFVCIFVARNWTWVGPHPGNAPGANSQWPSVHAMLGLLACVVAWAQPLNAVFRCHPKSSYRFIYNLYHRFFGYGAWLMAAAALMIACTHFDFMFLNRDAAFGLCIAFIATSGAVFITLELLSFCQWFKNRRATGDIEVVEPDGRTHVTLSTATKRMNICRMLILFFYLTVAIGCAVAISVMIGLRKNEEIRQTEAAYLSQIRNDNIN